MKEKKQIKTVNGREMDASLTVKLPTELREKVAAKSQATGIGISFVVRKSLEQWVSEGQAEQAK